VIPAGAGPTPGLKSTLEHPGRGREGPAALLIMGLTPAPCTTAGLDPIKLLKNTY